MRGTRSGTSTPDRRSARRRAPLLLLALLVLGFASATAAQDQTTSHATASLVSPTGAAIRASRFGWSRTAAPDSPAGWSAGTFSSR